MFLLALGVFFACDDVTDDVMLETSEWVEKIRPSILVTLSQGYSLKFRRFAVTIKYVHLTIKYTPLYRRRVKKQDEQFQESRTSSAISQYVFKPIMRYLRVVV